eukprot:1327583-Rhodomonas_salina.1
MSWQSWTLFQSTMRATKRDLDTWEEDVWREQEGCQQEEKCLRRGGEEGRADHSGGPAGGAWREQDVVFVDVAMAESKDMHFLQCREQLFREGLCCNGLPSSPQRADRNAAVFHDNVRPQVSREAEAEAAYKLLVFTQSPER